MPKINQEEYEVLKELDDKWKWIARSNLYGGKLEAHTSKPTRMLGSHWSNGDMTLEFLGGEHQLQFIQWEDEEPYNIQELINDYEYKTGTFDWATSLGRALHGESEEKEVKSKQELIEEWESAIEAAEFYGKGKEDRLIEYMKDFVSDLNQLDEPEVLSDKWIDDNSVYASSDGITEEYVHVHDLQNLLVPKQEEECPDTVARVIYEYMKATQRFKEVLGMEVEELEE